MIIARREVSQSIFKAGLVPCYGFTPIRVHSSSSWIVPHIQEAVRESCQEESEDEERGEGVGPSLCKSSADVLQAVLSWRTKDWPRQGGPRRIGLRWKEEDGPRLMGPWKRGKENISLPTEKTSEGRPKTGGTGEDSSTAYSQEKGGGSRYSRCMGSIGSFDWLSSL